MKDPERRSCPFCVENIPVAACVCPRCRQWLTLWSTRNPILQAVVVSFFGLAFLIGMGLFLTRAINRLQNGPPWYQDHQDAIRVLSQNFHWVDTKDGPRLFVTGILTNQSDIAWCALEMECRFQDASGRMVDAANSVARLTLSPHDDSAFRVTVVPGCARSEYESVKLSVSTARSTRGVY